MWVLGHTVLGSKLVHRFKPVTDRRSLFFVLIGTLLPDLIDKSLFYGFGGIQGPFEGTRTYGHTLFLSIFVCLHPKIRFIGFGMISHLFLDHFCDFLGGVLGWLSGRDLLSELQESFGFSNVRWEGLFWPVFGTQFPPYPYSSAVGHFLVSLKKLPTILAEGIAAAILIRYWWKWRMARELK